MNLVQHNQLFARTKFYKLKAGALFTFSSNGTTFLKVGPDSYGLPVPSQFSIPGPVGTVALDTGPLFYAKPATPVSSTGIDVFEPTPNPDLVYTGSTPGSTGSNGFDPVLGFPYAPTHYQLFIDSISTDQFARTNGVGGPASHLTWTVPTLNLLVIKQQHLNPFKWRVWFSLDNDFSHASQIDISATSGGQYIYPSAYLWCAEWTNGNTTPPTGPISNVGQAVPTGVTFNGNAELTFEAHPGFGIGDIKFTTQGADSIVLFTMERGHNDFDAGHVDLQITNGNTNLREFFDVSDRDPAMSYFYRLTGTTANGVTIPYNYCNLIHPFIFTASNATPHVLNWTAPTPAELAAWPVGPTA